MGVILGESFEVQKMIIYDKGISKNEKINEQVKNNVKKSSNVRSTNQVQSIAKPKFKINIL